MFILADIVNEYHNTYYRPIKMQPFDVKSSTYIGIGIKNNDKDSKFEFGDHVRISEFTYIWKKLQSILV